MVVEVERLMPFWWIILVSYRKDRMKRTMEKGLYTLEDGELIPEPTLSDKGKVETVFFCFCFYTFWLAGQQASHQERGEAVLQPVWNTVWKEIQSWAAHADAQGGGRQAEEERRKGESLKFAQLPTIPTLH